jgi:DNA polymerase I
LLAPYKTHEVRTSDEFREFLDWLRTRDGRYVALDTETSSADDLYTDQFRVRLIQLGDTQDAWVLPWDGWGRAAATALLEYKSRILIHNSAFDMAVLQRQGYPLNWAQVTDTMLAMRIAEPSKLSGLKESSDRHLDPDADLSQRDLKDAMRRNDWTWDTVPIDLPIFVQYSALDTILTARLYESAVVQDALRSPVWQLEMDTAAICARMANRGMRVDVEMCQQRYDRLMGEADLIRTRAQHDYGLNLGSTKDCGHWLFENPDSHPLMTKATAGGAISVDKEVMEKVMVSLPGTRAGSLAGAMLEVRAKEKIAKSYFKVFIDRADSDGMVHPSILTSEARSGRMSIRSPALQTLPKDDSVGVRGTVLPRCSQERLVTSDWDQIEMRLAAILSKDAGLLQAFRDADRDGGDFFTSMGADIYREPGFQKSDKRRRIVKNAMYGSLYGAGPAKVAITAKISLAEAVTTLDGIFKQYPGLRKLMQNAERQAKRDGYVTTLGGRRLTVEPMAAYKALNYVIQGSASNLLKRTLVEMACAGLEDHLVVPVHDEVVFSVPTDAVEDVRRVVAEIMPIRDLPLEIGAEPSEPMERWGSAS